ncbi:MAG TPA: hypothetical protein VNA27_15885, partial [Rubrobacteraceae bacterium]|nr:hypothetical protein [Rubrobacteraceae bacterium]
GASPQGGKETKTRGGDTVSEGTREQRSKDKGPLGELTDKGPLGPLTGKEGLGGLTDNLTGR